MPPRLFLPPGYPHMITDRSGDDIAPLLDVLSAVPQLIVVVDRSLSLRFMNRPQGGYTPEQVVGRSILDFMDPDYKDRVRALIEGVFRDGAPSAYEIPAVDAQGVRQWHEGVVVPVTRGGTVRAAVVSTTNVTERRKAQEEAEELRSLVPLCAWCRRIRTDEGYWHTVEAYIERSGTAKVTHGLCAACESGLDDEHPKQESA